mmetsp:Transcript_34977/g.81852  ORF Transcript_34977/g.81852 Transcript_34977/m.81852 type:complete len:307 (+) Transcript_34977:79-999(+)
MQSALAVSAVPEEDEEEEEEEEEEETTEPSTDTRSGPSGEAQPEGVLKTALKKPRPPDPQREFKGLPGVQEQDVKQAFNEIDFEGRGSFGVSELRYMLNIIGERPTDEELDAMLLMVDPDGNGKVHFENFLTLLDDDSVVLAEIVGMGARVRETQLANQSGDEEADDDPAASFGMVAMKQASVKEKELQLKIAAGFLHAKKMEERKRRQRIIPKSKKAATGHGRARPEDKGGMANRPRPKHLDVEDDEFRAQTNSPGEWGDMGPRKSNRNRAATKEPGQDWLASPIHHHRRTTVGSPKMGGWGTSP